jgi:hypothetical protein
LFQRQEKAPEGFSFKLLVGELVALVVPVVLQKLALLLVEELELVVVAEEPVEHSLVVVGS